MHTQYYYVDAESQATRGPLDLADLCALRAQQLVAATALVCRVAVDEWQALDAYPELVSERQPPPSSAVDPALSARPAVPAPAESAKPRGAVVAPASPGRRAPGRAVSGAVLSAVALAAAVGGFLAGATLAPRTAPRVVAPRAAAAPLAKLPTTGQAPAAAQATAAALAHVATPLPPGVARRPIVHSPSDTPGSVVIPGFDVVPAPPAAQTPVVTSTSRAEVSLPATQAPQTETVTTTGASAARGAEIATRILDEHPKLKVAVISGITFPKPDGIELYGTGAFGVSICFILPEESWYALTEHEKFDLQAYVADKVGWVRDHPEDYMIIPRSAPDYERNLERARHLVDGAWRIGSTQSYADDPDGNLYFKRVLAKGTAY